MADIYGAHFTYGGTASRKYGLIIASVESERMLKSSGEIRGNVFYGRATQSNKLISDDYSDSPLSFDIEFVTETDRGISQQDRREIERWLFNRREYKKLYIDQVDDPFCDMTELVDGVQKRLYFNCRFINPTKLEYFNGVVGYRATMECDSGFLWQDSVESTFDLEAAAGDTVSTFTVVVDTDVDEYTLPKVSFTMGDVGGDVTIINNTDDSTRFTKFIDIPANTTIVMDSRINYVSGSYYEYLAYQNFVRLLDGENGFTVVGNVDTITFEFQNRRML